MAAIALRDGIELQTDAEGVVRLVREAAGGRHELPRELAEAASAAIAAGSTEDERLAAWLDARFLAATARTAEIDRWAAEKALPSGKPLPLVVLAGAKYACHSCGACCDSYLVGPISEDERAAILARADEIAPAAHAPPDAWFVRSEDVGGAWALGRQANGRCVFLGPDNLCEIHRRVGGEVKPIVCQKFPLAFTRRPDSVVVTLRVQCESLARARQDGEPLERLQPWIRNIANRTPVAVVPPTVRLVADLHVPYRLARVLERRAIGLMGAASGVALAHAAIRDLLVGVLARLAPDSGVRTLAAAEAAAAEAPLAALRAARPTPVRPETAVEALGELLRLVVEAKSEVLEQRAHRRGTGTPAEARDRLFYEGIELAHGAAAGAPLALAPGEADPAVVDLVRALSVQLIGSSKSMTRPAGVIFGYGFLAFMQVAARSIARVLAARRGAAAPSPDDWNLAYAAADRGLALVDLARAHEVLAAFYMHLFTPEDAA